MELKYNVTAIVPIEIKEEPLKGSSFNGSKGARTHDLSRVSFTVRIKHRKGADSKPQSKYFTQLVSSFLKKQYCIQFVRAAT